MRGKGCGYGHRPPSPITFGVPESARQLGPPRFRLFPVRKTRAQASATKNSRSLRLLPPTHPIALPLQTCGSLPFKPISPAKHLSNTVLLIVEVPGFKQPTTTSCSHQTNTHVQTKTHMTHMFKHTTPFSHKKHTHFQAQNTS